MSTVRSAAERRSVWNSPPPGNRSMSPKTGSILIIDDEADVLESLDALLRTERYETVTATTAAEGLKKFDKEPFDLVLLDISLPDSSGLTFCGPSKEIRRKHR